jgi:hypothetical protein
MDEQSHRRKEPDPVSGGTRETPAVEILDEATEKAAVGTADRRGKGRGARDVAPRKELD